MAIGTKADFIIRPEQFNAGFLETFGYNIDVFNAGSNGAIRLVPLRQQGDYTATRFFDIVQDAVERRNPTSLADVADKNLTQSERIAIKLNRRFGPFAHTFDSFKKLGMDIDTMSFLLGQQAGNAFTEDYLKAALNSVVAAIKSESSLVYDHSGSGIVSHAALVRGLSRFGDATSRIVCWLSHSGSFFQLMEGSIEVAGGNVAGMTLYNGSVGTLGKPVVVTDAGPLVEIDDDEPVKYRTLGLVRDAVVVTESEGTSMVDDVITGKDNLIMRIQGEHAFNVEVKGFSWDISEGGLNPTDAALGTSANWEAIVGNRKDMAGVLIETAVEEPEEGD